MKVRHPVNILLVDDQAEQLRVMAEALANPSYRVVTAHSGVGALEAMLNDEFAVVLLDVRMPGMDGFETARLIRQRPRTHETPIIFLTGFDMSPEQLAAASSVGAADYLTKPVDVRLLGSKVRAFVRRRGGGVEPRGRGRGVLNRPTAGAPRPAHILSLSGPRPSGCRDRAASDPRYTPHSK